MTTDAITRCGDAIAVFEGPRRIQWSKSGPAAWNPLGVWPDALQLREMRRHIAQERTLLVVLDEPVRIVALVADELAAPADAASTLPKERSGEREGVRIAALDWLPGELRHRGLRFLDASVRHAARIPVPLRPALVLEAPKVSASHVRFAHRIRPSAALDHNMAGIIAQAFGTAGQGL